MTLIHVSDVSRPVPPPGARAAWAVDRPLTNEVVEGSQLVISGWVVAADRPAAVEIVDGDRVVGRTCVNQPRADIAAQYQDVPSSDRSGFHVTVPVTGWLPACLDIYAVTSSRTRLPIGALRVRRTWREALQSPTAPLVSVIITGEQGPLLDSTVQSVGAQTYPHLEIVAVGRWMSPMPAAGDAGVRFVESESDQDAEAWNLGIRRTIGDYLMFLRSGQLPAPEYIASSLARFGERPDIAAVLSGVPRGGSDERPDVASGLFRRSVFDHVIGFSTRVPEPLSDLSAVVAGQFPCERILTNTLRPARPDTTDPAKAPDATLRLGLADEDGR